MRHHFNYIFGYSKNSFINVNDKADKNDQQLKQQATKLEKFNFTKT